MAVAKKTKMRAQTQLDNTTDVAGSDGHLILADGTVKMDSEYSMTDRKQIAHGGFVAARLNSLLGVANSLSASLSWGATEAPLLNASGDTDVKSALTTLANKIDDAALGTASFQDLFDEHESAIGISASGQYVVSSSATYINTATSVHNATQILDYNLSQQASIRANEMQDLKDDLASTGSLSGSFMLGYSGHTGANGDFSISAKRLDLAIDDIVTAIDADRQEFDVFKDTDLISSAGGAGKGAVLVGYEGEDNSGGNNKFSVAAGTVRSALDAIVDAIDDDRFDLEAETSNASGAKKIGYDGKAGTNSKFTLAASKVDAALDAVVVAVDADIHAFDTYTGSLANTATGAGLIGYAGEDNSGGNNLFSVAAGTLEASLDAIVDAIDAEMKATDDHILALAATATGGGLVGYGGKTDATNGLFSVSAGNLEASLDAIVVGIDAEMKATDDHIAALSSSANVAGKGAAMVGYHGKSGANSLLVVGAKQVDEALDQMILFADVEAKAMDDHILDMANNSDAAKGAAKVGFKAYTAQEASQASNDGRSRFGVSGGTVKSALESIIEQIDLMEADDYVTGSVEYKIDQAVTAAIGGSADMVQTLAQLSSSLNALDDQSSSSLSASIQNMILEVKQDLRASVDPSLDTMLEIANRIEASASSTLTTTAQTLIEAINELDGANTSLSGSGGSALVGYDGHTGAQGRFQLAASQVDVALDSIVDAIDLDRDDLLSQTSAKGSAKIGYDGSGVQTNGLFELAASQVDAALDSIALKIDAEMKVLDDYQAELLSQVGAKGSAKIGYDGKAGAHSKLTLGASQVDAALDSLVDAIDDNRHALGALINSSGDYVAFSGKNYINGNATVAEDLSDLDAAIGTALANMGLTAAGQINLVAGDVRYIKTGGSIETSVEGALDKLDQALDTLETAVVDTKAGNAAFVRKGDHVTEEFDATNNQVLFTISAEAHQESVMVFVNGLLQRMGASYDWEFGSGGDDEIELKHASEPGDYVVIKYVKKTSA